jgi:hypothetical protein
LVDKLVVEVVKEHKIWGASNHVVAPNYEIICEWHYPVIRTFETMDTVFVIHHDDLSLFKPRVTLEARTKIVSCNSG